MAKRLKTPEREAEYESIVKQYLKTMEDAGKIRKNCGNLNFVAHFAT